MTVPGLINTLIQTLAWIANAALQLLPDTPFNIDITGIGSTALGVLNWVMPVGVIIGILAAWVAAIAIWYLVRILLRIVKVAA